MTIENMFEYATRNKLRFPFKGLISVEDLWDLDVRALDNIFKTLKAQEKKTQEESLLSTKSEEDAVLSIQIDIIKHIVSVKLAEAESAQQSKQRKEKRQKLMAILSEKQEEDLRSKSSEELQKMLEELEV